jgi:GcrA cell cycle regulator
MAWNEERTEQCVKLWNEGYSASQVAKMIGGRVSRNAVIGKLHRLGKKRDAPYRNYRPGSRNTGLNFGSRAWNEEQTDTLRDLWDHNASIAEIARRLSRSRNAVAGKALAIGLGARRTPRDLTCEAPLPPEPTRPDVLFKLIDLEDNQCRYFYGDPKQSADGYCGCQKAPGSSYCPGHHAKVWQSPTPRTKVTYFNEKVGKHMGRIPTRELAL